MWSMRRWPLDEKLGIEGNTAMGLGVELYHPAINPVRIELLIDGTVERVGEVNAPTIAAHFYHLRSTAHAPILGARVRRSRDDTADAYLARELGFHRIGYIVLLQVAGAPAGDIEELVVHGQIDVGDERGNRLEALQHRGQLVWIRWLGRDLDHLLDRPFPALPIPGPDRRRQVLQADHAIDETIGLGRIVRRPEFK